MLNKDDLRFNHYRLHDNRGVWEIVHLPTMIAVRDFEHKGVNNSTLKERLLRELEEEVAKKMTQDEE